MALYRLDFTDEHGAIQSPVKDTLMPGSDWICRHMRTARAQAIQVATESGRYVLVTGIGKAGALSAKLLIHPDGSASPPPGAKTTPLTNCTRGTDQACFCPSCRAERRATRRKA